VAEEVGVVAGSAVIGAQPQKSRAKDRKMQTKRNNNVSVLLTGSVRANIPFRFMLFPPLGGDCGLQKSFYK
jgi:hypothetical protein